MQIACRKQTQAVLKWHGEYIAFKNNNLYKITMTNENGMENNSAKNGVQIGHILPHFAVFAVFAICGSIPLHGCPADSFRAIADSTASAALRGKIKKSAARGGGARRFHRATAQRAGGANIDAIYRGIMPCWPAGAPRRLCLCRARTRSRWLRRGPRCVFSSPPARCPIPWTPWSRRTG